MHFVLSLFLSLSLINYSRWCCKYENNSLSLFLSVSLILIIIPAGVENTKITLSLSLSLSDREREREKERAYINFRIFLTSWNNAVLLFLALL